MGWFIDIKDKIVRYIATLRFLSAFEGKKKEIMRILQGINLIVLGVAGINPEWAPILYEKWSWLVVLAGHLGLEFAIEDEAIKIKQGIDPKSIPRPDGPVCLTDVTVEGTEVKPEPKVQTKDEYRRKYNRRSRGE